MPTSAFYLLFQSASLAHWADHIAFRWSLDYFMCLQNILAIKSAEGLLFACEQISCYFIINAAHGDDFDGNFLNGVLIKAYFLKEVPRYTVPVAPSPRTSVWL